MMMYEEARQMYEESKHHQLAPHTYLVRGCECYIVQLYGTNILRYYPDRVVFDSGGHRTKLTRGRMNKFSPVGTIVQRIGIWYIKAYGTLYVYEDGCYWTGSTWVNMAGEQLAKGSIVLLDDVG